MPENFSCEIGYHNYFCQKKPSNLVNISKAEEEAKLSNAELAHKVLLLWHTPVLLEKITIRLKFILEMDTLKFLQRLLCCKKVL